METLKELVNRLEKVQASKDPVEVKALLGWLEEGGLKSLEPSIIALLKDLKAPESFVLPVRAFDEWKEHSYDVFPYTTLTELKAMIAKDFGVNHFDLRFIGDYGDFEGAYVIKSKGKTTLGEILESAHLDPAAKFKAVVLPLDEVLAQWPKPITLPVRVILPDEESLTLTVPLTRTTTMKEVAKAVGKLTPDSQIVFVYPDEREVEFSMTSDDYVWTVWQRAGLFLVEIK